MPSYSGAPAQTPDDGEAGYQVNLAYDIDTEHSGSVVVTLGNLLSWSATDHVVLESLLAAIDASPDWSFVGGTRKWISGVEEITP